MITIISGTPGAGKTLYTIEKLVLPLVGKTITSTDEHGVTVEIPRKIYTNINGLQVDHELIDGGGIWQLHDTGSVKEWKFHGASGGLRDWHKWAEPGSVIVFDEVQKVWPPRANGAAIPPDVQTLDTHRHMGVDFILITQNVVNVDRHIHALGGRHLHVRRIANMPLAIVYEWDHVSRGLMFSKSLTKAPWRYNRKVFKLYKSAQLHTKQPRRLPGLVWFILVAIIAMAFLAPTLKARVDERFNPQAKPAMQQPEKSGAGGSLALSTPELSGASEPAFIDDRIAFMPRISNKPETAPAYDGLRVVVNMPQVAGGVCFKGVCKCMTQQGTDAGLSHRDCADWMKNPPFENYRARPEPMPPSRLTASTTQRDEVAPMASTSVNARVSVAEDSQSQQPAYLQALASRNSQVKSSITSSIN